MGLDDVNASGEGKLTKLAEYTTRCPACGAEAFKLVEYIYDMPLVGKVVLSSGKCGVCGYKFNDVKLAEPVGPQRIVFMVSSPKDLNVIVLKSSSASMKIPELGLEMTPGPASEGFITTVEGVLERFRNIVEFLCSQPEIDRNNCQKVLRNIEYALQGKKVFTLVIEDPEGSSKVLSEKARVEPLT